MGQINNRGYDQTTLGINLNTHIYAWSRANGYQGIHDRMGGVGWTGR